MRLRRLAALVVCLVGFGVTPASGVWGDTSQADGGSLQLLSLAAPTLACTDGLLSATVTWTASTTPTLLTYTAVVVQDTAGPLIIVVSGLNRTVTVGLGQLLSTLTGQTVTLRVTAALPGTSWTVSSDVLLDVGAVGIGVSCA